MTLLPASHFYPYLWHEMLQRWLEPFPDSYAIHRWWGTWRRQEQAAERVNDRALRWFPRSIVSRQQQN